MAPQRPPREEKQNSDSPRSGRAALPAAGARLPAGGRLSASGPAGLLALQRLAGNAAVTRAIQRQRSDDQEVEAPQADAPVQRAVQDELRRPGQPLDQATRSDMEARFGADFSDVRLHTGQAARESAASVGARAFTSGSHVVIGEGGADRHTLAHELTHVIQQRSGPVAGTDRGDGLRVSDPGDRFEREAEQQATRVLAGAPPAHADHAHTAHAAEGHTGHAGHTDAAGTSVQRMPRGRATLEPDTIPADARDQDNQIWQLQSLVAMYVPRERFDDAGRLVPAPMAAYTTPSRDFPEHAQIVSGTTLPRPAGRRGGALRTRWQVKFRTQFFVYTVELINDRQGRSSTLIDPDAAFTVVDKVPRDHGGHSIGRTYRFDDSWGTNPAHHADARELYELARARGLNMDNCVDGTDTRHLIQLPTDRHQPFVFYRPNIHDRHFSYANGTAKDSRGFMSARAFDRAAADPRRRPEEIRTRVAVSRPPTVDRAEAGRNPAAAMGNIAAHELMPDTGHGGGSGRLASHEWCHLIGDGDDGPSEFRNLVVGTNAVNTEQLAMETALRDFRARFASRGYAIRLTVTALLEPAELVVPTMPGGRYNKADWISFAIDVIADPGEHATSAQVNTAAAEFGLVHRQIMDASRGTITESEFTSLHHEVRNKLDRTYQDIVIHQQEEEERRARRRSRGPYHHSAMEDVHYY
ncbi:eCIS core domain-containing protein [Streptacidiphilus fuscans]|uniref:DUF4157 domain-containing protein n=1 Tax=Streptacidiphilus fuscans TaxID=2789292 RepID=A0A931B7Z1_9ACTN|nr:DUF4157 domain-containing protein [Streptacidiphilus fuscans]MBF9069503.1 DUF4157 domain-containing protein [Streptacidiphilus fuscans]